MSEDLEAVPGIRSHLGVMLGVTLALAVVLSVALGGGMEAFAGLVLISGCFATAYGLLVRPLALRLNSNLRGWRRIPVEALALAAASVSGGGLAWAVARVLGGEVDLLSVTLVGLGILTAIRLVEVRYDRLRRHAREVERAGEELRRRALEAEVGALRARTDPHFLFNALNTVAGLIEEDPDRAVAVVGRLAGYFRHAHAAAAAEEVPLGEELRAAEARLEIQGLRFGRYLRWSMEVAPEVETAPVIPFVLQPLVDNAVRHGLEEGRPMTVRVTARKLGRFLELAVEDDGPGARHPGRRGTGTALVDLRRRLELRWGRRAGLNVGPVTTGGFRARVRIPLPAEEVG